MSMPAVRSKYATNILGVLNNPDGVITATRKNRVYVFYMQVNVQNTILKTLQMEKKLCHVCLWVGDGALVNIRLLLYVQG